MSVEEQIKILCIKKGISVSELARINQTSPQAFTQKIKRNKMTPDDLKKIAKSIGCQYVTQFVVGDDVVTY